MSMCVCVCGGGELWTTPTMIGGVACGMGLPTDALERTWPESGFQ